MNPCINVPNNQTPSLTQERHTLLLEDELPKISLAKAKADEEPELQPFTKDDRNLFIYLTAMLVFQALLNLISSVIMRSHSEYCAVNVENYQIIVVVGAIFVIISLFVIIFVKLFQKHTYAIMSLILFFLCEAYLLGIVSCYFETLFVIFVCLMLIFNFFGLILFFFTGIQDRVSLRKAIPFVLISNILGFLIAFFSTKIEVYEAFGTLLAGANFSFFYVWLFKMIHLKKIHGRVNLFRLRFIAPVLIQIDLNFLFFFSIFFIGV